MYFPYLRNKQEEMFALKNLSSLITSSKKIIPIIEPVRENITHFNRLIESNMPFILIVNPEVPIRDSYSEKKVMDSIISKISDYKNFQIGYIIKKGTEKEIEIALSKYYNFPISFIHQHFFDTYFLLNESINKGANVVYNIFRTDELKYSYVNGFTKTAKVNLFDGFRKKRRNTDYPPESLFSNNIHLNFKANDFIGFGDYLTVGSEFQDSGSTPNEVAIHFTCNDEDNGEVYIRHFLSDLGGGQSNVQGKFLQANNLLIQALESEISHINTTGADLFRQQNTFPGLGMIKRYSIINHIELMNMFL